MAARWSSLYRTAYVLTGDQHLAEELLQGALARTCARWDKLRDKDAASAYVRRAMVNAASRSWSRRRREVLTDSLPERPSTEHADAHDDRLALWAAIRRLPPRQRMTLVLRYVEDLPEQAVARELGVTVGTVKSQTHQAIQKLRAALPDLELKS